MNSETETIPANIHPQKSQKNPPDSQDPLPTLGGEQQTTDALFA